MKIQQTNNLLGQEIMLPSVFRSMLLRSLQLKITFPALNLDNNMQPKLQNHINKQQKYKITRRARDDKGLKCTNFFPYIAKNSYLYIANFPSKNKRKIILRQLENYMAERLSKKHHQMVYLFKSVRFSINLYGKVKCRKVKEKDDPRSCFYRICLVYKKVARKQKSKLSRDAFSCEEI